VVARTRSSYHHGDVPRALKKAALEAIDRVGIAGLNLRQLARAIGVTHAAPYRHFSDKAALLAALATDGFETLATGMRKAAEEAGDDPLARLLATGRHYVIFATTNPSLYRVMYGSESPDRAAYPELEKSDNDAFSVLVNEVAAAQAGGQMITHQSPERMALLLWSVVDGATHISLSGAAERRGVTREEFPEFMMDATALLLGGLLKR
jgi:AcrR family transcriptional regulator